MTIMKSDTAVSDLIAVMALIAVFVTAAAIAGVALLSYPPGDAAPAMIARSVTDESGSTYIYHDGGDPLERGHFAILVDGVDRTENFSLVDASTEDPSPNTDWTSWKTGQALILVPNADVTISEDPHIQIVGEGMSRTGSDWLLHDIGNITPTPTAPTPVSPVANFIATPTSGEAPLAVNFTDLSTNAPTAWTWDFGDNATSDQRNPIHTYTAAGTYTVTLTATNAAGSDDEVKTGYITVSSGGGSGGGEAPVANFTANITEGNAPLAVQFTDTSTGVPTSWAWDFGDGNTATEQNPIHTYESPGNYSVTLNASNAYGYNVSAPTTITVLEPLVANFTYTPNEGNAPLAVTFNDTSTGNVTAWSWDFGDGNTSTEKNPIHTYVSAGNYTISLNASNAYGFNVSTVTDAVRVLEPPTAAFTATPTEGNAPLAVTFNDTSTGNVTAWLWNFGDGNTSTEQNPIHTYAAEGTYTVTLNASNAYGYNVSAPVTITVLEPPVANFTANVTEGNAPLTVQFTDESTGNVTAWLWNFGDANTSTEQSPSHIYASPGTYTVSLNASNAYGSSTETRVDYITVLEPPTAAFTATPTEGNAPLTVQFTDESTGNVTAWLWDFGDGNTSTEQNPVHTYESPGNYTVSLNASNAYGYNVSAPVTITVLESPAAAFTANVTEGNAPLTVQFTDESTGNVTAWLWDFGDGNTSTDQNPVHTYESPGNYTVSLNASNAYGFSTETRVDYITVLKSPAAAFTATPTEGNAPLTVQFTDESTGNVTAWLWDFGDGNTSTEQNPIHTYASAGNYTVFLNASNAYGYNVSAPVTITVLEPPVANFTYTPNEGNAPLTVTFNDTSTGNVTAWIWDFGDGNTSTEQNPSHTYASPGIYTVSLNASNAYGFNVSTVTDAVRVLEPPIAAFTATPTEGNAPLTVQFTDQSTGNVTAWAWDFGDGNTSTGQSPVHIYTSAGNYSVTMNASNAYGYNVSAPVTITVLEPPAAAFTANVTEGNAPLTVQFTDESTGNVTAWLWNFGDGNTSTEQNPVHTYASPGNYTVTLNASNAYGTASLSKPGYIRITEDSFINFIIDENVFVYGNTLKFSGNNINGPGATVVITGGLNTNDLNGGASIAVSDIYFDGAVTLDGGSADLGSPVQPGSIYVNGDLELWKGSRDIYGDVYVNGNFRLKDAKIHGNVYVNGDLTLDWTPTVAENARIYYTGTLTKPDNYDAGILAKCIHQATVPGFTMPDEEIPPTKPADWYAARGYVPDGALTDGVKIFTDSYTYTPKKGDLRAENVIVIARTGDIRIEKGGGCVTGIFFAPRGKVTFNGASLEGIVIARDGFFVTSGGTAVTFRNIEDCISNPEDYPF
jgi:PKD repeat protein